MGSTELPWVTADPAAVEGLPQALRIAGFRHYLGASLGREGNVHGWLSCYRSDGAGFGVSEIALLAALARQLGVIVENHRLQHVYGAARRIRGAAAARARLARLGHPLMYGLTLFSRAGKDAHRGRRPAACGQQPRQGERHRAARAARDALPAVRTAAALPASRSGLAHALQERLDIVERRVGIRVQDRIDDSFAIPYAAARELYLVATGVPQQFSHATHGRTRFASASQGTTAPCR